MPNPGMSQALQQAMQRRGLTGEATPALNQVSQGTPMSNPVPAPMPQSELTQASAPQGTPTPQASAKFQPTTAHELVVSALVEELKNNTSLEKEKMKMAQAQPAPQGGGGDKKMCGGGGFSMSPGYQQPMPINQMQGDYQSGRYSGLNNYGQGSRSF